MTEEQQLRARLREDPEDTDTRVRLAQILESRGRRRMAARQHFYLAASARRSGDQARLASALKQVLRLDPDYLILFTETPRKRRKQAGPDDPRLIVAHEEADVREALVPLLTSWGYHAQAARDPEAVLEALGQPAQLLLTGPRLGQNSGFELARTAKEMRPDISVILLTAAFRPQALPDRPESDASVVDEYLERPFSPRLFEDTLKACLWRARHTAEVPAAKTAEVEEPPEPEAEPEPASPAPLPKEPEADENTKQTTAEPEAGPSEQVYQLPAGLKAALVVAFGLLLIVAGHTYFGPGDRPDSAPAPAATPTPLPAPTPWQPPPAPEALWSSLSRTQQLGSVTVEVTHMTSELVESQAFHSARSEGSAVEAARLAASEALVPYDFDRFVYLNLAFSASGEAVLDPEVIYRSLRLDAPGVSPQMAVLEEPLFAPRVIRRSHPERGSSVQYLRFVAAFSRALLEQSPIMRVRAGGLGAQLDLSLPLAAPGSGKP